MREWLRNLGAGLAVAARAVAGTPVGVARAAVPVVRAAGGRLVEVTPLVGLQVLNALAAAETDPQRRLLLKAGAGVLQATVDRERAAADLAAREAAGASPAPGPFEAAARDD